MITRLEQNHYQVNCYIVADTASHQCAIVDPAAETAAERDELEATIEQQGLAPTLLLLTHAHVDHIAGLRFACERYNLPVTLHPDGQRLLRQAEAYGSVMGFAPGKVDNLSLQFIAPGDVLTLGQTLIECRYTPGHCPGSMSYYIASEGAVVTGDALFHFSIGRTDLPGGNYELLIESLKTQLLTLPDAVRVLPGHGIASTIERERRYNPYLQ
ncbi:MAG: MBL fold metallo-hydrolase [Bacteroidales bacterium]|nr:MBL fold metallo-hydrolase [Bacteroidales bacterium]